MDSRESGKIEFVWDSTVEDIVGEMKVKVLKLKTRKPVKLQ